MKDVRHQPTSKEMALRAISLLCCSWLLFGCSPRPDLSSIFLKEQATINDETWINIQLEQQKLQQNPEDILAHFDLARHYLQAIRESADNSLYEKAEQIMKSIDTLEPDHPQALFIRAQIALGKHEFKTAAQLGERLTQLDDRKPSSWGIVADAAIELGEYEQAEKALQTMVDLLPDFNAFTRIAYLREIYGDLEGAREAMELAIDGGSAISENMAWATAELARLTLGKNLEEAERIYQISLQISPNLVAAHEGLAKIQALKGDLDGCLKTLQEIFAMFPLPHLAAEIGDVFQLQNQTEKAKTYYQLVRISYEKLEEQGLNVGLEYAQFLADRGLELELAQQIAEKTYQERPTIYAADLISWITLQLGELDLAIEYNEKARSTGSQDASILYHSALLVQAKGDTIQAEELEQLARASNPAFSILFSKKGPINIDLPK
ncbi:MAG: tetratricopeptide repeat protein [Candidatus Altimarinota bacterium]